MSGQDIQKRKKSVFPVSRLKKIMQTNDDVGKMSASVPFVASRAVELFLKDFVGLTLEEVQKKEGANRITINHIQRALGSDPKFEFLKDLEMFR